MRRSRIDIVVEVLEVAKHGVNKTAIVYRTNLNFTLAEKYLTLLEKQGLIENKSEKYITSDKGKIFLGKAKDLTMQLETPLQKTTENPAQKAQEVIIQDEMPLHRIRQMTMQRLVPI